MRYKLIPRNERTGKTLYEVEMMVDGHSKNILMSADGVVVEAEEEES